MSSQQQKQKRHHDNSKSIRYFTLGDKVFAEIFQGNPHRWLPRAIVKVIGPVSYHVKLNDGRLIRHIDKIRQRDIPLTPLPKSKIIFQTYTLIYTYQTFPNQTALQLSKHRPKNQRPQIHNLSCVGQHATENIHIVMDNNCVFEKKVVFFAFFYCNGLVS